MSEPNLRTTTFLWLDRGAASSSGEAPEVLPATDGKGPVQVPTDHGLLLAFPGAGQAVRFLCDVLHRDGQASLPRAALHTGEAPFRGTEGRSSSTAARCIQLGAIGHPGQVLLSASTAELIADDLPPGCGLIHLGHFRLPDLARPKPIFQLLHPALPPQFPPLASLDALPHNIPIQLTSFIGRDRQLCDVKRLLGNDSRLVTLTGPGGCGKTRLAIQAAAEMAHTFADGIWLVEFAPLTDPRLIPQALAAALGVRGEPGLTLLETVQSHLEPRRVLLILDNCEHMISACADVALTLLNRCPTVSLLATSREPLALPGEAVLPVPSLSLPCGECEGLSEAEAVRLFVDRASSVQPGFALTAQNRAAVGKICMELDGIPLAIEMAATRVKALSPEEIARRLSDRFRLLTSGSRTALPRHQTLREAVDWSYNLLGPAERLFWQRASVFTGGFTLEAAEAVCAGGAIAPADVLDLLVQLLDKSMIHVVERGDVTRYTMLETIREYGLQRLAEAGCEEVLRNLHRDWFLTLAETAGQELSRAQQKDWLARMESERDNLRSALQWCRGQEHLEQGLRLAVALRPMFDMTGRLSEAMDWLCAFPLKDWLPAFLRAKVFFHLGTIALLQNDVAKAAEALERAVSIWRTTLDAAGLGESLFALGEVRESQGAHGDAESLYAEALETFRRAGDRRGVARTLVNLGALVKDTRRDFRRASGYYEESLAIMRELGNQVGVATVLHNLAVVAVDQGELSQATFLYEESLALMRELGYKWRVATILTNYANLSRLQDHHARAAELYKEALVLRRDLTHKVGVAVCLEGLAGVALECGAPERAAALLGAAEVIRAACNAPVKPGDREQQERYAAQVYQHLPADRAVRNWAEGRALSYDQAIELALVPVGPAGGSEPDLFEPKDPATGRPGGLTDRELEIVQLTAAGLSDREIAERLVISRYTVASHLRNIYAKLELPSRSRLAAWAFQQGIANADL